MQRKITDKEIQRAKESFLVQSKPFVDELARLYTLSTPEVIVTDTEAKTQHKETKEIAMLKAHINELKEKIQLDLEQGKFW